ncbi:A-agglutinin anchorage subunit-like isoform X2 [Juglans microcarpa x Juglans regia]|uniref:A-agglutinin anchorage subunit-like isoform X2 n=1 Tax=Juglans microcarpa x Juglans regia TaxID=2249226 RepID=UPI001B7E36BF|nr:A-agglutinin anchorage subunit-like isoform X2 [Juglans microcarpa x Juglans regia]
MVTGSSEDRKWSDKKMEEGDGSRTVESLRGRLLAERQASRVAEENAALLGKKLIELENQLKQETKLRYKAEKKLQVFMKKLESLNISTISVESERSSSSEKGEMSCTSSTITSDSKNQEEDESKSQFTSPEISEDLEHNASETTSTSTKNPSSPSTEKDSGSLGTANSKSNSKLNDPSQHRFSYKLSTSSEDPNTDNHSCSSLKSSIVDNESDQADKVDNSLALVAVSFPVTSKTVEVKPLNQSVREVLDALRHAREKLQSSMQRRHMIQAGPAYTHFCK